MAQHKGNLRISRLRTVALLLTVSAALIMLQGGVPGTASANGPGATPFGSLTAAAPDATCPQDGQCFADVVAGNPFFDFVNRIYQQDLVTGYACGGVGEPCDGNNRPYYRPSNNVTRQQMAKFIDNARRLPGIDVETPGGTTPIIGRNDTGSAIGAYSTSGQAFIAQSVSQSAIYAQSGDAAVISAYSTGGPNSIGVYGSANIGVQGSGQTGVLGTATGSSSSDGVIGFVSNSSCSPVCEGVYARETGDNGYALYASVANTNHPNDYGARITNYDLGNSALGLQVIGTGLATGGYSTGGSYQMVVRYNGAADLHMGDVLALDGNNDTLDGAPIFGTVKADGSNAAIGMAQYRYMVFNMPARPADGVHGAEPAYHNLQVDEKATTFKTGDYIELVVLGQAQLKPNGSVSVGDRLAVNSDGSISATKDATASIGRVGSKPDKDGYVSVFINFK
jgi:hypothetical protein